MNAAERVLDSLHGVRSNGQDSWMARCPAHEDRAPSLKITGKAGRVLLHCHAGCPTGDVVAALGLRMSDLWDEPLSGAQKQERHSRRSLRHIRDDLEHASTELLVIVSDTATRGWMSREEQERLLRCRKTLTAARDGLR